MSSRIKNLDPLRGFLALCVVIKHIPLISNTVGLPKFSDFPIFHRGNEAVLVFFSLSGFLIIGLLFDEKKKFGAISIKQFYIRRMLRIYPVFYLVLIFGFTYYHFLLPLFNIPYINSYSLIEGIALNVFFLSNVFLVDFEPGAILQVLWSIGIEEQFYLLIAPLLSLIPLKRFRNYLLAFTVIYFIIYHLDFFTFLKKYYLLYFFMSAGGLLAILMRLGHTVHFKNLKLRILVYTLFFLSFFTDLLLFESDFIQEAVQLVLFNLLIVNIANEDRFEIKNKAANYLGRISYGVYMYHMIVINLVLFVFMKLQENVQMADWIVILMINIISIIGTVIISHLSFKYYETYFMKLKHKFRKKDVKA
jgi:peptidoglycan/LPS O-acetylase OafA/YrhL